MITSFDRDVIADAIIFFDEIATFVLMTACAIFLIRSNLTITHSIANPTYSHRVRTGCGIRTLIDSPVQDCQSRRLYIQKSIYVQSFRPSL